LSHRCTMPHGVYCGGCNCLESHTERRLCPINLFLGIIAIPRYHLTTLCAFVNLRDIILKLGGSFSNVFQPPPHRLPPRSVIQVCTCKPRLCGTIIPSPCWMLRRRTNPELPTFRPIPPHLSNSPNLVANSVLAAFLQVPATSFPCPLQ
jgi:hypothetical protein